MFWKKKEQEHAAQRSQASVAQLLGEIIAARPFVTVHIAGHQEGHSGTSLMLQLDNHQRTLVIDALTPRELNDLMTKDSTVKISGRHKGIRWYFQSKLLNIVKKGQESLYVLAIPLEIHYWQRRESYRLSLKPTTRTQISMRRSSGQVISGQIVDISTSGARMRFSGMLEVLPFVGEVMMGGRMSLPDLSPMSFTAEVRFHSYERENRQFIVGLRFRELEPSDEHRLARFILEAQRELKRHRIETQD